MICWHRLHRETVNIKLIIDNKLRLVFGSGTARVSEIYKPGNFLVPSFTAPSNNSGSNPDASRAVTAT